MNKLISYLLFFLSFVCVSQNESFVFELKHNPNSEYTSEFKKSIKLKTEIKVDNETLKNFDSIGVKRIQKANKTESYRVLTKTKEKNEDQLIPIDISAFDFDYKGTFNKEKIDKTFKFKTLQAKGYVDSENNFAINEFLVDNKRSEQESEFISRFENMEIGIEFPKHKIGIGETVSFEHTLFYNLPLEGDNLYSVNCIATLVKVKKGIAYFKISSNQQSENRNYDMVVNGTLKLNIENNFACSISLKSTLHIDEFITDGFEIEHNYSEKNRVTTELKNISW
jgi:hypothetical protein